MARTCTPFAWTTSALLTLLVLPGTTPLAFAAEGKKVALIVGINKYHHAALNKPAPLEFAENDAAELADELKKGGYEVVTLTGKAATRKAIRARLDALRKRPGEGGIFLVALAGHGIQPEGSADAYYCPYDADQRVVRASDKDKDPWDYKTLLALSDVVAYLKASTAGSRVLLVDACRNDPRSGRGRGLGAGLKVGDLPDNTAVLLSCSRGQRSFEHKKWGTGHGAFVYQVLEGLRGKGEDKKGRVTADSLWAHVRKTVPKEVARVLGEEVEQRPFRLITGEVDLRLVRQVVYDLTGGYRFVHFGPDGLKVVLKFGDDGKFRIYDGPTFARVYGGDTGKALCPPLKHGGEVEHAVFSLDGRRVVTASKDETARVWDTATGKAISPPLKHDWWVSHAALSPDGRRVVTVSRTARVWDAATGKALFRPLKHDDRVRHAAFSPDGKRVVTASADKTARVWDAATGKAISPPLKHDGAVEHAAFSPDGKRVVTASENVVLLSEGKVAGEARVWDAATGKAISPPLKHNHFVLHAVFSADGKRVVTASQDHTARVWDAATGKALSPPLKHDRIVFHAAFSPDGKRVVTVSGTARVWDAASGKAISPPLKHEFGVIYAAFSPDGRRVVTAGKYGTARVWDAATGKEVKKVTISED
jgi:WD40 repeat protein